LILNKVNKIGAFFDLDGTVIVPPSLELRFAAHLARKGKLEPAAIARWLCILLKEGFKSHSSASDTPARLSSIDANKAYLAGVSASEVREWSDQYAGSLEFFPDAMRRISWHRERGHEVFFISGTLAPLAREVVRQIASSTEVSVAATELEEVDGLWTGQIAGEAVCGPAKAAALKLLAAMNEIDLSRSYAYGNSSGDRWMLAAVGNAVAVNPGITLTTLARRSGWRIVSWRQLESFAETLTERAGQPILSRRNLSWK
jgi:HAD superfamily hydrolase (TIGR01490 family)